MDDGFDVLREVEELERVAGGVLQRLADGEEGGLWRLYVVQWLDGRELNRINDEVRKLNDASAEVPDPPALWFARFIWSLPR